MDRYRDRFSVAGAKDDRLDARALAEAARLDRSHLRALDAQMPEVVQLRHCSRLCAQLNKDKVRLSNQLYHILRSYYPQFLELQVDLARTWVLELLMMVPTSHKAKRMHVSSIQKLLRKHRIRSQDAETIKRRLGNPSVSIAKGVTEGAVFQLNSVVNRLRLATEELKRTYDEMDRLIKAYDKALGERARKADGDLGAMQGHPVLFTRSRQNRPRNTACGSRRHPAVTRIIRTSCFRRHRPCDKKVQQDASCGAPSCRESSFAVRDLSLGTDRGPA